MRRVVTGEDAAGRAVVVSDDLVAGHAFESIPGMHATMLWATAPGPVDRSGRDPVPSLVHDVPGPGETRLHVIVFPPDAVYGDPDFDPERARQEQRRVSPDLSSLFEPGTPGTHATNTTDYMLVLSGEVVLEVDDGAEVELHAGDVVIANGNRHTWHNRTDTTAALLVVWIGPTG
jgi:uncharacterized cupin superfamily protein